jgi:hypothetical protein
MRKVILLTGMATAVVALASSCHEEPPYFPELFRISGTVSDSLTGLPIDSAMVIRMYNVAGSEYYSDSTGFYEVPVTEGNAPTLRVSKAGYVAKERAFQAVRQNINNEDFQLVPDGL